MRLCLLLLWLTLGCLPRTSGVVEEVPDTGDLERWSAFEDPESCRECHPTQVAEWEQSMHAYAALSPVFDAMAGKAWRDTSGQVGTFCTGCHSPLGTLQGEPGWTEAADRSDLSRRGVSCDACHTAVGHTGLVGNNEIIRDPHGAKQGPFDDPVSAMRHDSEQSDFLTSSEMCGSCHDVFMEPGLDIEEAYSEYQESPAYEEGVRCQDCHMGSDPGVAGDREYGPAAYVDGLDTPDREISSHRFIGPDLALIDEFPYPDDLEASAAAQLEYKEQVQRLLENSVELNGVRASKGEEDGILHLEVDVASKTTGHRVPTGFTSERQLWVQVILTVPREEDGNEWLEELSVTGAMDSNGDLYDEHSERVISGEKQVDPQLFNLQSENLAVARDWTAAGTVDPHGETDHELTIFPFDANSIVRNSLKPLEVRTASYEFDITEIARPFLLEVKLNYRAMPPYVLRALALDDLVDRLVVFEIDSFTLEVE